MFSSVHDDVIKWKHLPRYWPFCHHKGQWRGASMFAFVRGIHRWLLNSPHKGPVWPKMFPFDDVIVIIYIFILVPSWSAWGSQYEWFIWKWFKRNTRLSSKIFIVTTTPYYITINPELKKQQCTLAASKVKARSSDGQWVNHCGCIGTPSIKKNAKHLHSITHNNMATCFRK